MSRPYSRFETFDKKRSSFNPKKYAPPSFRESDEERRRRKEREEEERQYREGRERQREHDRRDADREHDEHYKRKSHDDRGKGIEREHPSKRTKTHEHPASSIQSSKRPTTELEVESDSPARAAKDFDIILKRPKYMLQSGPRHLEEKFPDWCFKGVRFDVDVNRIDTEALHKHLDVVREDVNQMGKWQKLCYEFQRVNRANLEAMVTMDSDKAEWEKILKAHEEEMAKVTSRNAELESEVTRLKDELASSLNVRETREQMLNAQLLDAHAAQKRAENALEAERSQVETYHKEVSQLRESSASQSEEIHNLKMQLAQSNKERDEAKLQLTKERNEVRLQNAQLTKERDDAQEAKTRAERELVETRAKIEETLGEFYFRCVIGKGSLDFLDDQFPITLAEIWERVLAEFEDPNHTDEQLQDYYLDDNSRQALLLGREELAAQRAQIEAAVKMSLEPSTVPQSDIAPEHEVHSSSDKDGSEDTHGFEVQTRIPPPKGNLLDEALPKDGSPDPFRIEELFADYECIHSPYVPQTPNFLGATDFSLSPLFVTDIATGEHASTAMTLPHVPQSTPLSQPGSQEPKIAALDDIEETFLSQEQAIEEHEGESAGAMTTPKQQSARGKGGEEGSGSSSKKEDSKGKGKKKIVSKRRRHIVGSGDGEEEKQEELEAGPTTTSPPTTRRKKILIKLGDESKGGQKK